MFRNGYRLANYKFIYFFPLAYENYAVCTFDGFYKRLCSYIYSYAFIQNIAKICECIWAYYTYNPDSNNHIHMNAIISFLFFPADLSLCFITSIHRINFFYKMNELPNITITREIFILIPINQCSIL